jgi:UDP-N-acetylmuramoylalanine--D-glutamate ligase
VKATIEADSRVVVLGLGASGRAAAALVDRLGGSTLATDDEGVGAKLGARLPPSCEAVDVTRACARIEEAAGVVTSPGVPRDHALLRAARAAGLPILSEPAFAAQFLDAPLLAVTGTNGKSTTVSVLAAMLVADGLRCFLGGNLGRPLCEAVGGAHDACVVEISSFQLEWPGTLAPRVASVLNVSPDHLDRHGDMATYVATKLRLFANMGTQDWAVLGRGQTWWQAPLADLVPRLTTFGADRLVGGEPGLRFDRGQRCMVADDGWRVDVGPAWPRHAFDWENLAAAAEMAHRFGVSAGAAERAAAEFEPLAHRLRRVAVCRGVEYWDDSKATNVGAALRSLEAFSQPVILLAGGVAKGADFGALAGVAAIKEVLAYGEAGPALVDALSGATPVRLLANMRAAFAEAVSLAEAGDVVLLAPACASFDEFGSYAERGRVFGELVAALGGAE